MSIGRILVPRGGLREAMIVSALITGVGACPALAKVCARIAAPAGVAFPVDDPQPSLEALSQVDVWDVLSDPLVMFLDGELRDTGFCLEQEIMHRTKTDTGWILMLAVADSGGEKVTRPDDGDWHASVRLCVQVFWENGRAVGTVESRVNWTDQEHITYMHELSIADHPEARFRAYDNIVNRELTRTVDFLEMNAGGSWVPAAGEPEGWSSSCIKGCLKDAGTKIGIFTAICLVGCLIVAGVASFVTGSAFQDTFKACFKLCKGLVLTGVGSSFWNCIKGCD